jgi:hypothetical protein
MEKAKIVLIRRTQLLVRIFKRVVDTTTMFIMQDVGMNTITMSTNIMMGVDMIMGTIIMIIQIVVVTITKMKN